MTTKQTQSTIDFQNLLNSVSSVRLNNEPTLLQVTRTVKNDTIYIEFTVPEEIKLLEFVEILDEHKVPIVSTKCFIETTSDTNIVIRLSCYKRKGT